MKNLYVPEGETLHYETLACQNIVVDGVLQVDEALYSKTISGKGFLDAGTISARQVVAMDIECATLIADVLVAERVCAAEVILSGSAVVSCYLEAEYVEVPKLTVAKSNIGTLKAEDVINLSEKKRGIFGTLAAAFLNRLYLEVLRNAPVDAPFVTANATEDDVGSDSQRQPERADECVSDLNPDSGTYMDADLENDFEFKRLKAMYRLLKDYGYTLRIVNQEPPVPIPQESSMPADTFQEAA